MREQSRFEKRKKQGKHKGGVAPREEITAFELNDPSLPRLMMPKSKWKKLYLQWELPTQQRRLIEGILRGMTSKKIARVMGIKGSTFRGHLQIIFRRFEVNDCVGLVLQVLDASHAKR